MLYWPQVSREQQAELAGARAEGLEQASLAQLLQVLIDRGQPVVAVDIHKGWAEAIS